MTTIFIVKGVEYNMEKDALLLGEPRLEGEGPLVLTMTALEDLILALPPERRRTLMENLGSRALREYWHRTEKVDASR